MSDAELAALRRRAYGRDGDIHLDPESLDRLRELEDARAEPPAAEEFEPEPETVAVEQEDPEPEPVRREPRVLPWILGLRRSTKLIALGALLLVGTLVTALVLVQRVQVDPLQVGATQVARLNVDAFYEVPTVLIGFDENGDQTGDTRGFSSFDGIRVLASSISFFRPIGGSGACITVFVDEKVTSATTSFEGPFYTGCAAGSFPATVQFTTDLDGLPDELVDRFPEATGLQFVYDEANEQIVVFADRTE